MGVVSFFNEVDTVKELSSYSLVMTHYRRSLLPRGSHMMGEKFFGRRDLVPMPPIHNVQHH